MSISEKYCRTLELDAVLAALAEYTCCDYAKERVLQLKPSTSLAVVTDEVAKTEEAFVLSARYGSPSFYKFDDPTAHLKVAAAGGVLASRALLNIAAILRQNRLLRDWFGQCKDGGSRLRPLFEGLTVQSTLEKRINSVFVSEDEIDDYASETLAQIRRKIRRLSAKIKEDLDRMIRSSSYQKMLQENIVTQRDGRYVVPVKAEYKSAFSGLVHDTSSSGATLFIEPMAVVEANNDIRVLQAEEKAEIERILSELSGLCGSIADTISDGFHHAIALNLYFAKADYGASLRAVAPAIGQDGVIRLNQARHPLIPKNQVVPISLELGKEYTSLVITGPNTGGKTVTLKTIGLLTLMTMCGMLIPVAEGSCISVFRQVLVDIGDEQSIAQNLSTFSAHMTNIVSILQKADDRSLVLVDELGSGTDPVEGSAIATAILEELRSRHAIVAATTHYAELKMYALQTPGVINAGCEFDVKTLRPTYRLLLGTPGRSNAFEISRRLGLPDQILEQASQNIESDKKSFEDVVDELETARQDYERKSAELASQLAALRKEKEELLHSNRVAIEEKERIIAKAREEAQRIVEHVRLDSRMLMDELEKIKRQKDSEEFSKLAAAARSQLRGKLDRLSDAANPVVERTNEDYVLPRKLRKGDNVLLVDIDKTGYLLEDPKGDFVLVQTGIIKSRVAISNLRLLEQGKKKQDKGSVKKTVTSNRVARGTLEVDLRGMTVEEALAELDLFLSQSLLSNVGLFTVIHGKGTGALRSAVHSYLKQSKYVKTFRLGVYGEGESGVTIVEMK